MFVKKKAHVLSGSIFATASLNLIMECGISIYRLLMKSNKSVEPDMLSTNVWNAQQVCSVIMLILTTAIFIFAINRFQHYRSLIPLEDRAEMAKLQEEVFGSKTPKLSSYSIIQLLQLWAAILICAQLMYQATSIIYKNFIEQLYNCVDLSDDASASLLAYIYNNSHGFKYIAMFIAIAVGIFITGVFLNDSLLKTCAVVLILLFVATISVTNMHTLTIGHHTIGVVWTSVLFHFLQTVGLIALSLYLAIKYKEL